MKNNKKSKFIQWSNLFFLIPLLNSVSFLGQAIQIKKLEKNNFFVHFYFFIFF